MYDLSYVDNLLPHQFDLITGWFKQGVDRARKFQVQSGLQLASTDTARLQLRNTLTTEPVDLLTTQNGRIVIDPTTQLMTLLFPGEQSARYNVQATVVTPPVSLTPRRPAWTNNMLAFFMRNGVVQPKTCFFLHGTLIVSTQNRVDRFKIDMLLLWEPGYTR